MSKKIILISISLSFSLFLQGCYTQLAMFYPEPEIEQEGEDQFFETYSRAPGRPGLDIYAQDEGSMPLGYSTMYNRFSPYGGAYMGFMNPYGHYNNYYYGYGDGYGYGQNMFGYSYNLGGYAMFIPVGDARQLRDFNKGRTKQFGTNLNVTRSSPRSSSGNQNNSGHTNSSSVSSNRSSESSSSSSSSSGSSSSSSGGRRATRRN
tara:strand:+ start:140 stop:754 length:615 start_codon:yes stop_codon:yes gene_type:complete